MKIRAMLQPQEVFQALEKAGIIPDATAVSRVVIDAARGRYTVLHIEMIAGKGLLDVVRTLDGARIVTEDDDGGMDVPVLDQEKPIRIVNPEGPQA